MHAWFTQAGCADCCCSLRACTISKWGRRKGIACGAGGRMGCKVILDLRKGAGQGGRQNLGVKNNRFLLSRQKCLEISCSMQKRAVVCGCNRGKSIPRHRSHQGHTTSKHTHNR